MDQEYEKPRPVVSGTGNTSGERDTQIVVRIPRFIPVHIRALGIEVTDIHEVAVRRATRFARHRPWLRQFANASKEDSGSD